MDDSRKPQPPAQSVKSATETDSTKTIELPKDFVTTQTNSSIGEDPQVAAIRKKEDDFRAGQNRVLQMIAANAPLSDVLNQLVLLMETQSPDMLCSVLLLSADGNHIVHGAAPSLPETYVKAVNGAPIGPKVGSCGTAMYRGEPVFATDILASPLWEDYRELASASGLRACWSTPIMSSRGKVLGSFAMYYADSRIPTGEEAVLIEVATRIAGLAIEQQATRQKQNLTE